MLDDLDMDAINIPFFSRFVEVNERNQLARKTCCRIKMENPSASASIDKPLNRESFQAYLKRHDLCQVFSAGNRLPSASQASSGGTGEQFMTRLSFSAPPVELQPLPNPVESFINALDAAILTRSGASRPVQTLPADCSQAKLSPQSISQLKLNFSGRRILLNVDATSYGGPAMLQARMEQIARFVQHLLAVPPIAQGHAAGEQLPLTKIVIAYTDDYEGVPMRKASNSSVELSTTHVGFGDATDSFISSMQDPCSSSSGVTKDPQTFREHLHANGGKSSSTGMRILSSLLFLENIDVLQVRSPASLLEPSLPFHDTVVVLPNMCHVIEEAASRSNSAALSVLDPILAFCDVYVVNSLRQFVRAGPLVSYIPRAIGECYLGPRAAADVLRFAELATSRCARSQAGRLRVLLLGDVDELSGDPEDPSLDVGAGGCHVLASGKCPGFTNMTSVLERCARNIELLCGKFDVILLAGAAAVEAHRQMAGKSQEIISGTASRPELQAAVAKLLLCVSAQSAVAHPTFQVKLLIATDFCILKKTASGKAKVDCVSTEFLTSHVLPTKYYVADVGPRTRQAFQEVLSQAALVLAIGAVTVTNDHVEASRAPRSAHTLLKLNNAGEVVDDLADLNVNSSVSWMSRSLRHPTTADGGGDLTTKEPREDRARGSWSICGESWFLHALRLQGAAAIPQPPVAEWLSSVPKCLMQANEDRDLRLRKKSILAASGVTAVLQGLESELGIRALSLPYDLVASLAVGEQLPLFVQFPAPIPTEKYK